MKGPIDLRVQKALKRAQPTRSSAGVTHRRPVWRGSIASMKEGDRLELLKAWANVTSPVEARTLLDVKYEIDSFVDAVDGALVSAELDEAEAARACDRFARYGGLNAQLSYRFRHHATESVFRLYSNNPSSESFIELRDSVAIDKAKLSDLIEERDSEEEARESLEREKQDLERRERLRKGAIDELSVYSAAMRSLITSPFVVQAKTAAPMMSPRDKQLARSWMENERDKARMMSARTAELAVRRYYERLGCDTIDTAIEQLGNASSRWKTCDMLVDGRPLDVKNSRRSFTSTDRYVEHCVPRWKLHRNSRDVSIVGALSDYVSAEVLLGQAEGGGGTVVILGEVTQTEKDLLVDWFEEDGLLKIHLGRSQNQAHFLPPWMFSYPSHLYSARDRALKGLPVDAPHSDIWRHAGLSPFPFSIISGRPDVQGLPSEESSLAHQLAQAVDYFGPALPALFLTILRYWLRALRRGETRGRVPSDYRRQIYFGTEYTLYPLLIFDPMQSIDGLINALDHLCQRFTIEAISFESYKLSGPNILKAYSHDAGDWVTIMAYCGGRDESGRKCGRNPLVLGSEEHCRSCWRLICGDCGFCSPQCLQTHR
jgi:hypothetical protein